MSTVNFGISKSDIDAVLMRHYNPTREDHVERWFAMREYYLVRAMQARTKANSYRGFKVGCAVLAYNPNAYFVEDRWQIFEGANRKLSPNDPKFCAELAAVLEARAVGCSQVIGLVVVGEPQRDGGSGLLHPTLHPCEACRVNLPAMPEISFDTLILTATPDEEFVEEFTLGELVALHA